MQLRYQIRNDGSITEYESVQTQDLEDSHKEILDAEKENEYKQSLTTLTELTTLPCPIFFINDLTMKLDKKDNIAFNSHLIWCRCSLYCL